MNKVKTDSKNTVPITACGATIFISSACLMALELAAGRIAAKQFGSSLYTWTSVIGVTLAGLTLGNYIGGRIADRFPLRPAIGRLFAASSAVCVAAIVINNLAGEWSFLWRLGPAARVLAHITITFFIPSALIGAISPVAVKMALEPNQPKGRVVGRMYALGAAGSIAGTFLAGFWLIAAIGTINTVWVIVVVFLIGAVFYLPRSLTMCLYAGLITALIATGTFPAKWAENLGRALALRQLPQSDILYETESQYGYIAVRQISKQPDERQFIEDNLKSHSKIIMDNIRDLRFFYTQVYSAVTRRTAGKKEKLNTLSIGGGGYVFPRYILDVFPGSRADVAEIDPAVTEAAIHAFGLPRDSNVRTFNLDGRNYVDQLLEQKRRGKQTPEYDFVYMDAFNDVSVPYQLVTRQFNEKIFDILAPDGVYLVNMIDLNKGGAFVASFVNTAGQTFPYVYVATRPSPYDLPKNFIVIAAKRPLNLDNLDNTYLPPRQNETSPTSQPAKYTESVPILILDDNDLSVIKKTPGWTILDDDYVPAENLMSPVVRLSAEVAAAEKYLDLAWKLNSSGRWQEALSKCHSIIKVCPALSVEAYNFMANILADKGRLPEAADALSSVLALCEARQDKDNVANVHYRLAVIYRNLGNSQEASKHFASATDLLRSELTRDGGSAEKFWRLGQVQAARRNAKEAMQFFEKALAKNPEVIKYHLAVIEGFALQRQFDQAIQQANKSIQYMLSQGRKNDAEQLKEIMRRLETENRK